MAQYGAPWQALLNTDAEPVDTERNSTFDKMSGVDEQSGDDSTTQFVKGLQSSLLRNSPRGRDVTMEIMKAKLANQMAIQLEEAKKQLNQKYPTYQIEKTPFGSEVFDPTTGKIISHEDFPGAKELFGETNKAKMGAEVAKSQLEASPEYIAAKKAEALGAPALQDARTKEANAMALIRPAEAQHLMAQTDNINNPKPKPQPPLNTADIDRITNNYYKRHGYDPKAKSNSFLDPEGLKAKALEPGLQAEIAKEQAERAAGRGGPSTPDVGNMLDFNSDD